MEQIYNTIVERVYENYDIETLNDDNVDMVVLN